MDTYTSTKPAWNLAATVAIDWWINQMTGIDAASPRLSRAQADAFMLFLRAKLDAYFNWQMQQPAMPRVEALLMTDYAPQGWLDEALKATGITAAVPARTTMYVGLESVLLVRNEDYRVYLMGRPGRG
jgi:hypothetical protein